MGKKGKYGEAIREVDNRIGVSGKVIENIARKFRRSIIKWMELIDVSFLPEDMKKPYKRLVLQRLLWLR